MSDIDEHLPLWMQRLEKALKEEKEKDLQKQQKKDSS